MRSLWRRLCQNLPWPRPGRPTWGDQPPKILGICRQCGAVVLEGWHRQVGNGYICQRCAGKRD